ncbi:MAG TPA: AMP-binding protein, partial [Phenylobacterium sp.]|nr:AMP-binding protein [Phenylobacterium sp.]
MVLRPSTHLDSFARDHLPDPATWPLLTFDRPELQYPDRLNCGEVLLDGAISEGCGDRLAILHRDRRLTYADLHRLSDAYARVLQMAQVRPGARVLLRGDNTPELFAAWLAVVRIGAIAVTTMPMLRARELGPIIRKARVAVALCEAGLDAELRLAAAAEPVLRTILTFGAPGADVEQAVQGGADPV